jgi:polar amino acid transport system permease protein
MKSLFIKKSGVKPNRVALLLNSLILLLFALVLISFAFGKIEYSYNWKSLISYRAVFIDGFLITLSISIVSLFVSILLGITLALSQRSPLYFISLASKWFVELVRGTPLLVQVLIFFYVIASAFGIENRFLSGVIILSLFSGAYLAEIIRGGIESVGKHHRETAKAIGLTTFQTYRYVIAPLVLRAVLPAIAGQLVSLIKDSSLLSIIAVRELTMAANEMNAATFSTIEAYLPLVVGYLLLTMPISLLAKRLEKGISFES